VVEQAGGARRSPAEASLLDGIVGPAPLLAEVLARGRGSVGVFALLGVVGDRALDLVVEPRNCLGEGSSRLCVRGFVRRLSVVGLSVSGLVRAALLD
jgi:hypothetical protein